MNYVGIDIGSTASKVVALGDKNIEFVLPTGWSSKEAVDEIKNILLSYEIDVCDDNTKVVATGYGRISVDFADKIITEITCHGKGGTEIAKGDCTIIDIGGQDTKVIIVENNFVSDFIMNDKCSAGTGKFIEVMTNRLGLTQNELSDLARKGEHITISSMCTVFAESEVISLIGRGTPREDIAFGVIESVVMKVVQLIAQVPSDKYFLTGGLCEDQYVIERLENALHASVTSDPLARYAGAIGAALMGAEQ